MTRGRLAVHAHFYQPARLDPWTGEVPAEPSAAPFHDWNERVNAECYRPNAARGNLAHISWDLGPTLGSWLAAKDAGTFAGFVAAGVAGNAIGQSFHHTILPLASAADRTTEIRWGIREFELRFGRRPEGLWLPETAVDVPTLRIADREGIVFTILAPWQAAEPVDTRRPYRVDLGNGRSIVVVFYDAGLSSAVSFEPEATSDADRFARERIAARVSPAPGVDPTLGPLAVIATDGELYGHHQQFRDLFLQRLVAPAAGSAERTFDVVSLADAIREAPGQRHPLVRIAERTSWSCHHGVARWSAECPDAADGRWKGPLRAALERLAAAIDVVTADAFRSLPGSPDLSTLRDAYVDVVVGSMTPDAFATTALGGSVEPRKTDRGRLLTLLGAQRWRLAMFASDGWYWDDPIRSETKQVLRSAARAARLVDGMAGTTLEQRLLADLELFVSPSRGLDGAEIYRTALVEIGQPAPR